MTTDGSGRWHGLDALRAVALMSGVLLHALLAFVAKPGDWAVGRAEAQPFLAWLYIYIHAFRLEVFFLLAGFFGALIVSKRGVRAYAKDRVVRILLVFIVALYPIKALVDALWITGGTLTGWMHLPPEYLPWPLWRQVLQSLVAERWQWPAINLAHLWFLYVLSYIIALFLIARALAQRWPPPAALSDRLSAWLRAAAAYPAWPIVAALVLTPVIAGMHSPIIDTPDMSFAWNVPVSLLDGLWFAFGWWLHGQQDLLQVFARRCLPLLALGLLMSLAVAVGAMLRAAGGGWPAAHPVLFRAIDAFAIAVTMTASVFGWLGAFVRFGARPSPAARYLSDASYWVYLAHLPVVVALQVLLVRSGLPWWIQVPFITATTLGVLLVAYQYGVRRTWVGAWLNGRRR